MWMQRFCDNCQDLFFVGLPNVSSICEISQCILRSVPLASNFDVEFIIHKTDGYSGSNLKELFRSVALENLN